MRALHTRHRHHNDVYARRVWFLLAVDDYIVWAPFKTNQPACLSVREHSVSETVRRNAGDRSARGIS